MNNVWGADTPQCLTVDAAGRFEVTHPEHDKRDGSAAAAYPTIYQGCHWGNCTVGSGLPIKVGQLRSARSDWTIDTRGATGRWNATYDLWFHTDANAHRSPDGAELMVWLDRAGGAEPAGTLVARGGTAAPGSPPGRSRSRSTSEPAQPPPARQAYPVHRAACSNGRSSATIG
ncbi:GH12 family glycosyl hydrolase domain-containing protein [Micromonospora sp. LOL_015]|uniref:GH12 family glycosyl hydrolase domain-containing protein n=1 Tax=Micromonospora sp. LOL_015 TaxID=3345416 RepID=UPI003A8A38FB